MLRRRYIYNSSKNCEDGVMTKKTDPDIAKNTQPTSTDVSPLAQLQDIVFGEAQRAMTQKIDDLAATFNQHISQLKEAHQVSVSSLQSSITQLEKSILNKLNESNQAFDKKTQDLQQDIASTKTQLSSEIEMTDTSGKEDIEAVHSRIDQELRDINALLNEYKAQTLEKLSDVNNELNSSKTDRKTLAKLLATMATNLEADETNN